MNLTKWRLFDYEINLIKIEVVDFETSVISVMRLFMPIGL